MDLTELIAALAGLEDRARPTDRAIVGGIGAVAQTCHDEEASAARTLDALERTLGHSWIEDPELHARIADLIEQWRKHVWDNPA